MKKFLNEFKTFALRGNVMDLAVGMIIGSAFTAIVTALKDNFIQPILDFVTRTHTADYYTKEILLGYLSAFISAVLINALVRGVKGEGSGFSAVIGLLVLQFGYIIFSSLLKNLNSAINRISNELVANHIKTKIINKAKTLDLRNFDMPEFYSMLENANN